MNQARRSFFFSILFKIFQISSQKNIQFLLLDSAYLFHTNIFAYFFINLWCNNYETLADWSSKTLQWFQKKLRILFLFLDTVFMSSREVIIASITMAKMIYSIFCFRLIIKKWYFVTKIILPYCEIKLFLWAIKEFEIPGWQPRICKKKSEQFLKLLRLTER